MSIYIINLILIFIWCFFAIILKIKNKSLLITIIIGIQLFILSAFRDGSVGADTYTYIDRFYIIIFHGWESLYNLREIIDFEIGFIVYNKIVGSIVPNDRLLLIVTSAIIIFSVAKYIYKDSKIAWLSFFIFITFGFWGMTLNTLRQSIAIAILLPSIKYIINKQFVKFCLIVLIATLFHISAISFLIMYPLSKIKISKFYVGLIFAGGIFIYLYAKNIISILLDLFDYHQHYDRIGEGTGAGMLILLITILFVALLYRKSGLNKINNYDLYIHFLVVAIFLNILALEFNLAGRAMQYFSIYTIILIPNIIYSINLKIDRLIGTFIVLIGSIYFYWIRLVTDTGSIVPYEFVSY